jgi:ATP-binding cassette subfamily C (CFTR/MRP) protein 4
MFLLTTAQEKGFRRFCRLIARMTAIQRILEYTKQKQECKNGTLVENWPQGGEIRFENVYLSYNNRSDVILNDLKFTLKSGEKIAVVGRTAAGKTSLISTLLRLYKFKGKIFFDGVDIATIPLDVLRSNISVVPQEPFLFSGTIRENIDPLGQHSDDRVWNVIKTVNLETLFSNLEYKISGADCSLSTGQKQLLCLGRALIRNNKVVILDEITANVDSEVEEMIYKIIKECFINCTVIMITQKLNLIEACDTIMVLDWGRIIETGSPSVLLNDRRGMFYNMLKMYR